MFNQTVDEPIHIAAGYEWLTTRGYHLDPEHPPLARIPFAAASVLRGIRDDLSGDRHAAGTRLLLARGSYRTNLALARAPNLIWFLLTLAIVGMWTLRLFGPSAALIAMAVCSSLPPLLAHAGLATTDMAAAATVTAALFCYATWLRYPSWRNALWLALAIGAGLIAKFSFPVFFAAGALALSAGGLRHAQHTWAPKARAAQIATVAAIAILIVCAAYKFSFGRIHDVRVRIGYPPGSVEATSARYDDAAGYDWVRADIVARYRAYGRFAESQGKKDIDFADWAGAAGYPSPRAGRYGNTMAGAPPLPSLSFADRIKEPFRRAWQTVAMRVPLPAPWFIGGLEYVRWHATGLHPAFLLGRYSDRGWWYYFPVVFFFKTPLPLIALAIAGIVLLARNAWRERDGERLGVAIAPVVMFVPAMMTSLNIGVRHILPVYPLLCMAAAYAAIKLVRFRVIVVLLLVWYFASTALAHPDYLAWFNEAAGSHPERIAVDSNLDWGQDLFRLRETMRREHIEHLSLAYFGSIGPKQLGVDAVALPPHERRTGWIAISEMRLAFGMAASPGDYAWLKQYPPAARAGRSIRLYRIP